MKLIPVNNPRALYLVITHPRCNFLLGQAPRSDDKFCRFFYFRGIASRSVDSPLIRRNAKTRKIKSSLKQHFWLHVCWLSRKLAFNSVRAGKFREWKSSACYWQIWIVAWPWTHHTVDASEQKKRMRNNGCLARHLKRFIWSLCAPWQLVIGY